MSTTATFSWQAPTAANAFSKLATISSSVCLLAAIACYVYGVAAGGALALVFFLTLGVVFEITFWIRALRQANP